MDHNGWVDIAYNGLACPHGYVFEGRGVQKRSAANGTNSANATSAVICYLGGQGDPFTLEGQQAMQDGAAWLGDPMARGHRDWYPTQCPGDEIYGWIHAPHPPIPPIPPTPGVDETVLHLIKGDKSVEWWITDYVTKSYVQTPGDAAQIVFDTIAQGGKIEQTNNGPVVKPQSFVDHIPVSK
jgi:hypothetical protein